MHQAKREAAIALQINLIEFDDDDDARRTALLGLGGTADVGDVRVTRRANGEVDVDVSRLSAAKRGERAALSRLNMLFERVLELAAVAGIARDKLDGPSQCIDALRAEAEERNRRWMQVSCAVNRLAGVCDIDLADGDAVKAIGAATESVANLWVKLAGEEQAAASARQEYAGVCDRLDEANAQLGAVRSAAAAALLGRGRSVSADRDEAQLVEQLAGLVVEDAETFARQLGTIAQLEADVARERAGRLEAGRRAERDGKRLDRIVDALAVEAGRGILRPLLRRLGRVIGGARG